MDQDIHYTHGQILWELRRYLKKEAKKNGLKQLRFGKVVFSNDVKAIQTEGTVNFLIKYTNPIGSTEWIYFFIEDGHIVAQNRFNVEKANLSNQEYLSLTYENFMTLCCYKHNPVILDWWQRVLNFLRW